MADTIARLRRTALVMPDVLRAGRLGKTLSLAALARGIGSDPATLTTDLDALQDIEFESGDLPNYFSFEIAGDSLEVRTVPLMLQGAPAHIRLTEPEASALLSFLDELELDAEHDQTLEELESQIAHIAGAPEGVRSWSAGGPIPAEEIFTTLLEATRESRRCRISYTGSGGQLYDTVIEPYHLRMERGLWYAIARLAEGPHAGEERCFRLDKIAEAEAGEPFKPNSINLTRYADGVFQPSGEPKVATIVFSDEVAAYAEERWGPGRAVTGGVEIDVEYYDEGWLERTLAVFGGEAQFQRMHEVRGQGRTY